MAMLKILGWASPSTFEATSPGELGALHPAWAGDLAARAPLRAERSARGGEWTAPLDGGCDVTVCGPCGTTMDVAHALWKEGALNAWGSVLAPVQSSGRGQLRRPWLCAPGNLFVTLVCPQATGQWNELRPLVFGYLLAEALEGLFGAVRIKWPNDILMDDRKVGGILVEERGDCILVGIGLNLVWAPGAEELRECHAVTAGMIPASSASLGPLGLWLSLVNRLETGYRTLLETHSPAEFLTLFRSRLAWAGRRVLVQEGARTRYAAIITGVSEKGELVLNRDGDEVVLVSGDVTPV